MEASTRLSYSEFLEQYNYIKNVVKSCKTEFQLQSAKEWAEDWSKRMKHLAPEFVDSSTDLYLSVIEH
jgi:hypothetical protein